MTTSTLERTNPADTSSIPIVASVNLAPGRLRGFDRVLMIVSIGILRFAMHRADRNAIAMQDHALWLANSRSQATREGTALKSRLALR